MGPLLWSLAYKGWLRKLFLITCMTGATIWWSDRSIRTRTAEHVFDRIEQIPHKRVGVVLGTSEKVRSGRPNLFFEHRMKAAVELYRSGKVDRLLLSGDNRTIHYNEPWAMRKALIAAGVDSTHITLDYAGFRTLDSVVRAREVFGQQSFTVISQRFHNERAVYIARRKGIDAIGYNARDVDAYSGFRTRLREKLARVKVFLDLLMDVEPHFLGEPVLIA
jgi:SanA protein